MIVYPAVLVYGQKDAKAVLAIARPATLLSAPGAALSAGCLWWREMIQTARAQYPDSQSLDLLDCADASGFALEALRCGINHLILCPNAPNRHAVASVAARQGGTILSHAPHALDLAIRGANRRLSAWLATERNDSAISLPSS